MKKLERSYKDKMLYGVLGGLAETLGVPSLYVRLVYLVFFFACGGFVPAILYMALGLFLPEQDIFDLLDEAKPKDS